MNAAVPTDPVAARIRRIFVLLIGLTSAAGASFGCDDVSSGGVTKRAPATTLPVGNLSQGFHGDIHELLNQPLAAGLRLTLEGKPAGELLLLEINPTRMEPVVLGDTGNGMSAGQALHKHALEVVIGSGFVSELHSLQPVGLLQVDGKTLSPIQGHGYTRILGVNDHGIGVIHKETYQRGLFHSALQVGPGIIEEGKLDISERELKRPEYFRSFVAVCESRWLVGVSLAPTHLHTLGQTLVAYFNRRGWSCEDVVNLAGDRQAVLVVRTSVTDAAYHGDPNTHKASLLGFRSLRLAQ